MIIKSVQYLKKIIATHFLYYIFFFVSLGVISNSLAQTDARSQNSVSLLNISGAIGPATQDFIHRGIVRAVKSNEPLIILRLDTPGGLNNSMRGIIQDILTSPIPVITYVAPSGARAASAGTYILYASHVAAMAPGTNLGAASPVAIGLPIQADEQKSKKAPSMTEQKSINDAKAYIRSLAQLRHRNVEWAEKAVSQAESLSAEEALKMNVINLIANDTQDLLQKINGMKMTVGGSLQELHTNNLKIHEVSPDWRTRFLAIITDPSIAYILLIVGFYGIVFEFMNPGFVLPGVAGVIAILIALYAFQLLPVNYAGLGLIIVGIGFIIAEVFVPAYGALGIGGIISFIIGSIMLIDVDTAGFHIPLTLIITISLVTVLFFIVIMNLALRSRRKKIISGEEGMIGQTGIIIKEEDDWWVRVNGELWRFHSTSTLHPGQKVIIKSVSDLVLIVEPENKM